MSTKAHVYGNHVDTDVIIPARFLNQSDLAHLASHCMVDIDPEFSNRVQQGDVIIAGNNFGCGSSREHAPLAIKASGVKYVIAKSFARIFLRNALNIGLAVIEADTSLLEAESHDLIEVSMTEGLVKNISKNTRVSFKPPSPFMTKLIEAGGLVPYTRMKGGDT